MNLIKGISLKPTMIYKAIYREDKQTLEKQESGYVEAIILDKIVAVTTDEGEIIHYPANYYFDIEKEE